MGWNHESRTYVFATLLDYFGPYREWKGKTRPGDKNIKYKEVMELLSDGLDNNFGFRPKPKAVENQIALLIKPGGMLSHNPQGIMRCIVAAIESGFCKPSDIRDLGYRLTKNKKDMSDKFLGIAEVEAELVIAK